MKTCSSATALTAFTTDNVRESILATGTSMTILATKQTTSTAWRIITMNSMILALQSQAERISNAAEKTFSSIGFHVDGDPSEILLTLGAAFVILLMLSKGAKAK